MKKKTSVFIIAWEAIYPVLLYYAIMLVVQQVLVWLVTTFVADASAISADYPLISAIRTVVTIPFLFSLYCNDRNANAGMLAYLGTHKPSVRGGQLLRAVCAGAATICLGFAVSNLISLTPLVALSSGYQTANEALFSGSLLTQLINSALFVPILEELVFRGIVQSRLQKRMPVALAIVLSAILFGIMHGNLVQGIYGFVLGLILGTFAYWTGHIYPAVFAHMAVNAFTLLCSEFEWFSWMKKGGTGAYLSIGVALCLGLLLMFLFGKFLTILDDAIDECDGNPQ